MNLRAYADYAAFVKVFERVVTDVGDISCDLLRSELCFSRLDLVFFNMDRCINIVAYYFFIYKDCVLVVVALPCHKSDESVFAE